MGAINIKSNGQCWRLEVAQECFGAAVGAIVNLIGKANDLARLKGFRHPPMVIAYVVWAYHRFGLSLRDVENLMEERGVIVSHESIRAWVASFGPQFAAKIRHDRQRQSDKWYLDEMGITMGGEKHWLWWSVAANGDVLDILIQSRRNKAAAKRFFRKLFKRWGEPRVLITDKLRSYCAAKVELAPGIEHRQHKGLNNRVEALHRHTRRREKIMGRFKSPRQAQRFLSFHDQTACPLPLANSHKEGQFNHDNPIQS